MLHSCCTRRLVAALPEKNVHSFRRFSVFFPAESESTGTHRYIQQNIPTTLQTLNTIKHCDQVPLALERPTLHDFRTGQTTNK